MSSSNSFQLPYCHYPSAKEGKHHLQPIPSELSELPLISFDKLLATMPGVDNSKYELRVLQGVPPSMLEDAAVVVADGFVKREPMSRHIVQCSIAPISADYIVKDFMGKSPYGPWTKERCVYWYVRRYIYSKPSGKCNDETLSVSHVLVNKSTGKVAVSMLSEVYDVPIPESERPAVTDPLEVALSKAYQTHIYTMLDEQHYRAVPFLCKKFPNFKRALKMRKVVHPLVLARTDDVTASEAAYTLMRHLMLLQSKGFWYAIVEATNPWSGAVLEQLGGIRVDYSPHLLTKKLKESTSPLPDEHASSNGYLAMKDVGSMLYVVRLADKVGSNL